MVGSSQKRLDAHNEELIGLGLDYVVGVQSTTTVWPPGTAPLSPPPWKGGRGRAGTPAAPRCGTRARQRKATGPLPAREGMENRHLAGGSATCAALPLRCVQGSRRPSRSQAAPAPARRMAADRVAPRPGCTAQILAVESACLHPAAQTGGARETALDHRTRLSGTEAGTRSRSLRRPRLARLPSSRHSRGRRLWLPGGRA